MIVTAAPRIRAQAKSLIETIDSPHLGKMTEATGRLLRGLMARPLSASVRAAIEATQPLNPLGRVENLPAVEIAVPCADKDLDVLSLAVWGAVANSRNPVGAVSIITPPELHDQIRDAIPWAAVLSDEEVVGTELLSIIGEFVPAARRGWVIQQVVKLQRARTSDFPGTLVVDADTVLLRPRTWLTSGGVQSLALSREYHLPYVDHFNRFVDDEPMVSTVSFVTHHQLMQRDVVSEIFGSRQTSLLQWIRCADWRQSSPISEYHTYGTWISARHRERVRWVQWRNETCLKAHLPSPDLDPSQRMAILRSIHPRAYSVSLHEYLSENP